MHVCTGNPYMPQLPPSPRSWYRCHVPPLGVWFRAPARGSGDGAPEVRARVSPSQLALTPFKPRHKTVRPGLSFGLELTPLWDHHLIQPLELGFQIPALGSSLGPSYLRTRGRPPGLIHPCPIQLFYVHPYEPGVCFLYSSPLS